MRCEPCWSQTVRLEQCTVTMPHYLTWITTRFASCTNLISGHFVSRRPKDTWKTFGEMPQAKSLGTLGQSVSVYARQDDSMNSSTFGRSRRLGRMLNVNWN